MNLFTDLLVNVLERKELTLGEFQSVVLRLLDRQIILRTVTEKDRQLYDQYVMMQEVIDEYLRLMCVAVHWDEQIGCIIAYPPGAHVPGEGEPEELPTGLGQVIQRKINIEEKGLLLTLRLLYEEAAQEGQLNEHALAVLSLEAIYTRFESVMKRPMNSSDTERERSFKTLKKLRIIHQMGKFDDSDSLVSISPVVLKVVLGSVVAATRQTLGVITPVPKEDEPHAAEPETQDDPDELVEADELTNLATATRPSLFSA